MRVYGLSSSSGHDVGLLRSERSSGRASPLLIAGCWTNGSDVEQTGSWKRAPVWVICEKGN